MTIQNNHTHIFETRTNTRHRAGEHPPGQVKDNILSEHKQGTRVILGMKKAESV